MDRWTDYIQEAQLLQTDSASNMVVSYGWNNIYMCGTV